MKGALNGLGGLVLCIGLVSCAAVPGPGAPASDPGRRDGRVESPPTPAAPAPSPRVPPERSAKPVSPPQPVARVTPTPEAASLLARAEQALAVEDYDMAALWLSRAQRLSPNAGEVYLAMALLQARQQQWQQAEQFCLRAIALAGQDQGFRQRAEAMLERVRRRQS